MATLDEKDIESVGAGEGKAAYQFDKDSGFGYGQLDAFEDMSKGVKVKSEMRAEDRAKAKEDNKIEVKGGDALSNQVENKDNENGKALSFGKKVGKALSNFSNYMEKNYEKVMTDPGKRTMFLSGLNTLIESSQYTPIGEASSLVGKVAKGQKKGIMEGIAIGQKEREQDIERTKAQASLAKALKGEPPRIRDTIEEAILKEYTGEGGFLSRKRDTDTKYQAQDARFTELYKLAQKGFQAPTGLVEGFFTPFEKIAQELGFSEKIDELRKNIINQKDIKSIPINLQNEFKDTFQALTKAAIVSQVKDLYPASDKDIQVLLSTAGDIFTNPEALRKLVSAQKALSEISKLQGNLAKNIAFTEKDINFEEESKKRSAETLAGELTKEVDDKTLMSLYGDTERNPFRVINAYYYNQLQPTIDKPLQDPFSVFKSTKTEQIKTQNDLVDQVTTDLLTK